MTRGAAVGAVALLLAMSLVPMLSDTSESAVSGTYDVYIKKGYTWTTSYTYTASLSPAASIVISDTAVTDSTTGWSSTTTGSTAVSAVKSTTSGTTRSASVSLDTANHEVDLVIAISTANTTNDFYVGVKLTTYNPTQNAITVFHIHMTDPTLTGYSGGSFYNGQTITDQKPTLSAGGSQTASDVTYTIGTGSNNKTLAQNTGLSFDSSTGKISGKVTKTTNSAVTYNVTASFSLASEGYHTSATATTTVTIGTYSSASLAEKSAYAIKNTNSVTVAAPSTTGITYSLQSATYTLDGGTSKSITVGTAFNGLKVNANGSVSGTPTVSGKYVISENFKVNETNQTGVRKVTVTVEDQIAVSLVSTVNTYTAGSDSGTIATASHTESKKVTGTWKVDNSNFSIASDGKITAKSELAGGTYTVEATYTSSASSTNYATKTVTVYVDENLALSCSDSDKKLYTATDTKYLSGDVESATVTQTADLHAGTKTVTYALSSSTLTVGTDVSIDEDGKITLANSYAASKVGTHTVTVTCTDDTVSANKATMNITVTIVEAMVLGEPEIGSISSS